MLKKFENCSCGREHKADIKEIITGKNAIGKIPDCVRRYGAKNIFLIADDNTYKAAGKRVCELLKQENISYKLHLFHDKCLEPDERAIGAVAMSYGRKSDMVIGVGSGVINDIGKMLSNIAGVPYIIVATAPSMDGYASASSSMNQNGLKVSIPTKSADIIIGDADVLCNAPQKMLIAGLGDMLAKYISICEWRISHIITGEYYCEEIARMVRDALKKCTDNADGLLKRDETAVMAVFDGLTACGVAMTYAGLSRPASGVEHYLSHIWDMRGLEFGTPVELHGIQCALGTWIAANLYAKIKQITPDREKALAYVKSFDFAAWSETMRSFLGRGAESMIALEAKEQKYDAKKHAERLEVIIENWAEIQKIIEEEIPGTAELEAIADIIGTPKCPEDISLDSSILPLTFRMTKDIRDKYVLSRLCWDLGIIDELFSGKETKL